ncbi:MAG TPA: OmpA family protein [Flavitalea sp.]|nr:OmpA family protein [Flavitalea sp.]
MIRKLIYILLMLTTSLGAFAQTARTDSVSPVRTDSVSPVRTDSVSPARTDSVSPRYDTVSTVPDSYGNVDSSQKVLIGQTTVSTSDTVKRADSGLSIDPDKKLEPKKLDRRWFISPFLKFQAQEFGMLEQQRRKFESDAYLLPLPSKSMISAAASVYKNFSKNISVSLDLGAGIGHMTSKDSLISTTKSKTAGIVNFTLYHHLLGGNYKLQPFISGGINTTISKGTYMSAPVGAGIKFTSKHVMIEGQGAYGYSLSKNIANTIVYSVGVYIPFRTKKQKEEDRAAKGSDTSKINIINITNNYYLLSNRDSVLKAEQDSIKKEEDRATLLRLIEDSIAYATLDPDDPMRLKAAKKYIIYFYYDQYSLTTSAFGTIDQVISRMKGNPTLMVHLKGHTDQSGSEQYNSPLSKRRAKMVFDYLNSMGIGSDRIIQSSYGKLNPAVKNEDPNTAWMNRRCEIVLYEKE